MKRNTDIREYTRAFYQKNRLCGLTALLLTVLDIGGNLIFSYLLGEVTDTIALGSLSRLWNILWLSVAVAVAVCLIDAAMYRLRSRFVHRALAQYKALAFSRLTEKSISAFSRENTGRYLSVLTNDASSIEENYLDRSFELVFYSVLFAGALVMMFWCSWILALAAILLSILPVAVSLGIGSQLSSREKAVSDRNEGFMATVKDVLTGFSVVKSFKAEAQVSRLFEQANVQVEQAKERRRWWEGLLSSISSFCSIIVQFGIFLLGAYLAIRGSITVGTVLIIVNLCNFILQPIRIVPQYWASRKAAQGLIEKLAEVTQENAGRTGQAIEPVLKDAIALEHLTFGYQPGEPVLKDLSLKLEAGKKYAIVGGSGCGKSTLLNLLMGAYGGYEGSLTVDGVQLRDIDTDSLYDLSSLIGQSVFLFDDTLRNNITMFREFPEEQLEMAIRRSGLSELAARRGLDYRCGENGVNLSGGERQRVSIARCLLRGTPVLLLDEATAALDNQTAYEVTEAILQLDGLTRVVVTHRLEEALMAQYDEIIVLRDGRVREQGSFRALMERKGYLYSLFTLAA